MGAKPKRRYTDQERANAFAALAANGGNAERTARQLGIPSATLRAWSNGSRHPEAVQAGEGRKRDLADQLEAIAYKLLEAVPGKIAGASFRQLMIGLGIAIDKMVLLRGQPPTSSALPVLTSEERMARLAELVERFRCSRDGAADGAAPLGALPAGASTEASRREASGAGAAR